MYGVLDWDSRDQGSNPHLVMENQGRGIVKNDSLNITHTLEILLQYNWNKSESSRLHVTHMESQWGVMDRLRDSNPYLTMETYQSYGGNGKTTVF